MFAAARSPYRFVKQKSLKHFTQTFVGLGATYGHVPASDFIAGHRGVGTGPADPAVAGPKLNRVNRNPQFIVLS